jgi:uncharacterized protein YkwD
MYDPRRLISGTVRRLIALFACCAVVSLARPAWAVGEPINGFPNWAERVIHEWINRARVDPQLEMNACGSPCVERACYSAMPPLTWSAALNRSARFHSDEMVRQGYFAHTSACTLVSNIDALYPASCNGSASCACVGGVKACSPTCTDFAKRVQLFGGSPSGEIIASPSDPNTSFYLWLYETGDTTSCQFTSANGHRWLILSSTGAVGAGVAGYSTGDFGAGGAPTKIPSGAHYPQQAASVDAWANWYDSAGPSFASVNVDGTCTAMTLRRGTQTNGAWSATVSGVGTGCHRYYFSFRDAGGATVTYPTTGSLAIGTGASCPDWDSSRPAACGGTTSPIPSDTPTPTPTQTRLPSPTATHTAVATASLTPTATRTAVATASLTRTPIPTATPTAPATATMSIPGPQIGGSIRYYSNAQPVPGASVRGTGAVDTTTDAAGRYVLAGVASQNVAITAAKTGGVGQAISALDAAYVLQYVAGLRALSATQILACDVTGNGALSALDATLLLQRSAGSITTFPVNGACNGDWAFIPDPAPAPAQSLVAPHWATGQCIPGAIDYATVNGSLDDQNFSAFVIGDCTGNWQPPSTSSALRAVRGGDTGAARVRRLPGGRMVVSVAAAAGDPIAAFAVDITYDPAALRIVHTRTGGAARGAAVAINDRTPGVLRIAAASGAPLPADGRPLVRAEFAAITAEPGSAPAVSVRFDRD